MAGDLGLRTVDTTTPAVVLKLDPNPFHHGGLGVIRTLGRMGVSVHAVYEGPMMPAATSRYVHGRWRWAPGADQPERVLSGLRQIAEKIGRAAVLIPTDDVGAIFIAEHAGELRRLFLFPEPDPDLPRRLAGKQSLAELCRGSAISSPRSAMPGSAQEALAFVDLVGLPVFAKLAAPWSAPGSAPGSPLGSASESAPGGVRRSTTILSTRDEVAAFFGASSGAVLLQEEVPGGPDWFFHGYCDAGSVCRPAFTGVKERSYPAHAGLTTLGVAVANDRLRRDVERLLSQVGYRGIVDLDLRWDPRQDRFQLLDFNPRVGAQFRLFEDATGLDVVRAAYLDLTGQPIPPEAPMSARRFVVENYDPLAAVAYNRRGELTPRTWLRSVRGVDEAAWFARDDLVPFAVMLLRFGWRALTRPFGRDTRRDSARPPRFRPGRARRRRGTRVVAGVVSMLALVAALAVAGWAYRSGDRDVPLTGNVPPHELPLGAFLGSDSTGVAGIDGFGSWLGATVTVGRTYLPGKSWDDLEGPDWLLDPWSAWHAARAGRMLVLNVPMVAPNEPPVGDSEAARLLADGAAGRYDTHFRALAQRLVERRAGDTVIVLGWEMNGTTYSGRCAAAPDAWKQYWRRIVSIMRTVPGQRFRFDFAPVRGEQAIGWTHCYPGDDVVDIVGMDSYDQSPGRTFREFVSQPYGLQAQADFAAAHGKPMSYPEWGLYDFGDDPSYVCAMHSWITTHDVAYQSITDYCPHGVWSCDRNPESSRAYRQAFGPKRGCSPTG